GNFDLHPVLRRAILTQRVPCERLSWRHTPLGATRPPPFRAKPRGRAASLSCAPTQRTAPRRVGTHHICPLGNRPRWSQWEGMPIPPNCASSSELYPVTNWNSLLRKLCQSRAGTLSQRHARLIGTAAERVESASALPTLFNDPFTAAGRVVPWGSITV